MKILKGTQWEGRTNEQKLTVLCPITDSSINTTEFWTKFFKVTFKKYQRILSFHLGPSIQTKCHYYGEVLKKKKKKENNFAKELVTKGNSLLLFLERKKESEVAQSCPTLWDPMDCSLPGSSVYGIFQARILEWVAISFYRRSSWPRDWTWISHIVGRHFTVWATLLGPLFLEVLWKRDLFLSSGKK